MKLKNIILVILAMVLVSVVTVGITVAYLTDTDKVDNVITLGDVGIKLREYERVSVDTPNASAEAQVQTFNDNKPLLPAVVTKDFDYAAKDADVKWDKDKDGNKIKPNYTSSIWDPADINNEVDKMVFVENTGKSDAYVRVFFAFEAGNYTSFTRFKDMVHINLNDAASEWKWEWNPALATSDKGGNYFIATATYLPILKSGEFTTISLSQIALDPTAINKDVLAFGEKYEVSVFVQGIQTVGFDNSDQALTKGFGDDIPFTNLKFVTPVDLKTALHYLNGDKTSDVLVGTATVNNDKVSSVTFGLAEDHYADVSGYKGVLTTNGSEENKFTAFTYYVQNADGKYDIYVLSDEGEIYAPKICDSLFLSMSSLSTVDTSNLNVSGTTSMKSMFRNCANLKSIDVSGWNVSNVTDMTYMFYNDKALNTLNVSKWNVSAVKKMRSTFHNCSSLGALDVSGWDVSSVTDIRNIFENCCKIKTLAVDQWADSLKGRTVEVTAAFYKCNALVTADISNWNIIVSGAMTNMLRGCSKLTTPLNFSGWDVSAVTKMDGVFMGCNSLTELDLGSWNTKKVIDCEQMFQDCSNLKTISVGENWDMSQVEEVPKNGDQEKLSSDNMFLNCTALVGGKGTAYDANKTNKEYAIIDGTGGKLGYLTYKPAENTTPEQN
jgi:predicted ribosomally synthesized peptide with SipW-like signal peptide